MGIRCSTRDWWCHDIRCWPTNVPDLSSIPTKSYNLGKANDRLKGWVWGPRPTKGPFSLIHFRAEPPTKVFFFFLLELFGASGKNKCNQKAKKPRPKPKLKKQSNKLSRIEGRAEFLRPFVRRPENLEKAKKSSRKLKAEWSEKLEKLGSRPPGARTGIVKQFVGRPPQPNLVSTWCLLNFGKVRDWSEKNKCF